MGRVHLPLRLGTPLHGGAAWLRLRTLGDPGSALRSVVGLAEAIGHPDVDEVARISVIANSWQPWRRTASVSELRRAATRDRSDRATGRERRGPLQVLGGSHLADALATGRGVVLVAPHVAIVPILPALPHLDDRPVLPLDARGSTTVDRTRQLRDAHRTLRAGGAVLILADEFIGDGGIMIDIAGKDRPLRPGFARLAQATESEVVPVFPSFDTSGRVTIDVRAPMGAATEDALLVDFGAMLRTFWHEHTGSLSWYIVRRHLNYTA
jgi:lauroyl/myristoyl acyltransferase